MTRRQVLTGQGNAQSQLYIEEGGGGALSSIAVKDEGILIGNVTKINFTGGGVTATLDADPTQVNVDVPAAGSLTVNSSASIDSGALIKNSGVNTYAMLGIADSPLLMVAVATSAVVGAGAFTMRTVPGSITTMLSDGTVPIANGATVVPSTTTPGRVKPGSVDVVGVNVGAAILALADAAVSVL